MVTKDLPISLWFSPYGFFYRDVSSALLQFVNQCFFFFLITRVLTLSATEARKIGEGTLRLVCLTKVDANELCPVVSIVRDCQLSRLLRLQRTGEKEADTFQGGKMLTGEDLAITYRGGGRALSLPIFLEGKRLL